MNKIDIKNIKRILEVRNLQNQFDNGGEISKTTLENFFTEALLKLVENYNNNEREKFSKILRKEVDEIFNKYAEDDENMIVIKACNYEDRYYYPIDSSDIFNYIDFDNYKYNKFVRAIGAECQYEYDDKFNKSIRRIYDSLVDNDYISDIVDFYREDDSLNEVWYGCYGITKDYTVVSFIIRGNGMLLNNEEPYVVFEF